MNLHHLNLPVSLCCLCPLSKISPFCLTKARTWLSLGKCVYSRHLIIFVGIVVDLAILKKELHWEALSLALPPDSMGSALSPLPSLSFPPALSPTSNNLLLCPGQGNSFRTLGISASTHNDLSRNSFWKSNSTYPEQKPSENHLNQLCCLQN